MQGKIVKGIAGFYYVWAEGQIYECKAKGVFRKDKKKPLVGDDVKFYVLDEGKKLGNITELLPRHSELVRPAVANVDQALVIFAIIKPQPNLNLLDRFLIMMRQQSLPCIICLNKLDIDEMGDSAVYEEIYKNSGCKVICVSAATKCNIDALKEMLRGKTTTVAGPSGAGKSSLVNCLKNDIVMKTGDISAKIERGRHTTRHSELIAIEPGTYILDTPGFSALSLFGMEKEELAGYYPEFAGYEKYCRFGGCSHISEPVCGIRDAVEEGAVSRMRYDNYCQLYEELKRQRRF